MRARIAHTGDADRHFRPAGIIFVEVEPAVSVRSGCLLAGNRFEGFFFGYAAIEEAAGG